MVEIKKAVEKIPGGLMIVPLLLGAVNHTLFPSAAATLGSFTGALMTGALPILAVFYLCMGSTIELKMAPYIIKKGGALFAAKIATGALIGVAASRFLGKGQIDTGLFAGLSVLAIIACMNDTNGGLYMALIGQFGRKEDAAAYSVMSLESGPFFTMVTLGTAGLAAFPWQSFVGAILPLMAGMILGNLDRDMRDFLGKAVPVMIPFFAFALGNTLNLADVWRAGLLGLFMGVAVIVLSGAVLIPADKLTGGTGLAGVAATSTAGNAAAVPAAIAVLDESYAPIAPAATMLVASSVIVTAILVPLLTAWWAKRSGAEVPSA